MVAANNVTQFIYIENQYFRWPPLAELIKKSAVTQTCWGRDPALHGSIHLFVITNDTKEAMGLGTVKTQEMLASLGRAKAGRMASGDRQENQGD
ncbi:putative phospholipase D family protein [Pseudomonas syringae pv. actinidiae ICMP 19071]|nr:putative phospholipase D family protein [Pseudomonas syringae pv. actinidiae ICMP 19071]